MRDPRPSQVAFITANEQTVMERDYQPPTGRSKPWDGDISRTTSQRIREKEVHSGLLPLKSANPLIF